MVSIKGSFGDVIKKRKTQITKIPQRSRRVLGVLLEFEGPESKVRSRFFRIIRETSVVNPFRSAMPWMTLVIG